MYYGYADSTYILVLIGMVITLIAQFKVKTTFKKYSKIAGASGLNGADAAQRILYAAGIHDVPVQHIAGDLTDNYNPVNRTLNLSDSTMYSNSVAAIGVAAHECGHAIQHATGYSPLKLRSTIYPVVNIGSRLAWPVIVVGLIVNSRMGAPILMIGILLFSLSVIFSLVTLPVEFNASRRAVQVLRNSGMMSEQEISMVKKVLSAAAMTYVAASAAAILSLLRIILLSNRRR